MVFSDTRPDRELPPPGALWCSILTSNWSLQRLAHNELTSTPPHRLIHFHILPWTKTNTTEHFTMHKLIHDQPYPLSHTLCLLHTLQIFILTSYAGLLQG